uniref:ATP synthase complex subunit 8 n=1 Tax=Pelvicachromis pulcher TaxID=28827 RepID=A0A8F9WI07_PELPU|nr:ATP synthase F0 subunit 8 [Pelvicachromis pulcher]
MPQLNPAPWFPTLIFSWFTFLTLVPPKVLAHIFPNEPAFQDTGKAKMNTWSWPWP